jgi:2'-5' RNA ligase
VSCPINLLLEFSLFFEQYHKFATVQADVPEPLRSKLIAWGKTVPDDQLAPDGRSDSHVTALYGLHDDDPKAVKKILKNFPSFEVTLKSLTKFEAPDYDVLKIDVESPELREVNKVLKSLPHTDKYTTYKPHLTIAYVKKGFSLPNPDKFRGEKFKAKELTFSSRDGTKHIIKLI